MSLSLFLLNHFVGLKVVAIVCFPLFNFHKVRFHHNHHRSNEPGRQTASGHMLPGLYEASRRVYRMSRRADSNALGGSTLGFEMTDGARHPAECHGKLFFGCDLAPWVTGGTEQLATKIKNAGWLKQSRQSRNCQIKYATPGTMTGI